MRELLNVLDEIKRKKKSTVYISIVGGGGKTNLMYSLGRNLTENGKKVLLTTTTMIFPPEEYQMRYLDQLLIGTEELEAYVRGEKQPQKPLVLGKVKTESDGKLKGFEASEMEVLHEKGYFSKFDYVVIEADGAKQCPIKAPAAHEPVLTKKTDLVIGVIGMDALDKPMVEGNVHRVKELSSILEKKEGELIQDEDFIKLAISENGLFKNAGSSMKKALVLNKSEGFDTINRAEEIIHELRRKEQSIDYFFVTSAEQDLIYKYFPLKIAKIVFGAGRATRMGKQKLLLDLHGKAILERVLETVESLTFGPYSEAIKGIETETVFVYHEESVKEIAEKAGVTHFVHNPAPERGLSSSLKLAVSDLPKDVSAYLFIMGDQPFIKKETLEELIRYWLKDTGRIVVPYINGKRGNPTLFSSEFYDKLMKVEGDRGGRDLIVSNLDKVVFLEVEDPSEGLDIDDPETYELLKGKMI